MMSGKKCVLFDLDGTLFDSSEGIKMSYREGLQHFGITVEDDSELDKVIGPSLYVSYHDFYGLSGEDLKEAIAAYRRRYNEEGIFRLRMYDGTEEMLAALKASGHIIGLATSKPLVMAERILDFSGLKQYFDVVCGSHLDGSMSDKCELIHACMTRAAFSDKACVYMVGDRNYDIVGAIKSGIRSIGVTYGFGSREELREAQAEFIADSPRQVVEILTGD